MKRRHFSVSECTFLGEYSNSGRARRPPEAQQSFRGNDSPPPKPNPHRRDEVTRGHSRNTMRAARFLPILILAGTLANTANASDDLFSATQGTANHSRFAGTNTAEADAGNDDSANQPPPVLDRRDRIFYPGDTERPKPLL